MILFERLWKQRRKVLYHKRFWMRLNDASSCLIMPLPHVFDLFPSLSQCHRGKKKRVDWWSHRDKNGRAGQTFSEKILTSAILQSTGFELSCLGLPWVAMICWADSRLSPAAVCGVRHVLWKICETLINFLHCIHRRLQRIWLCWLFFFPSCFQKPGFSSLDFAKQGVYSPVVLSIGQNWSSRWF